MEDPAEANGELIFIARVRAINNGRIHLSFERHKLSDIFGRIKPLFYDFPLEIVHGSANVGDDVSYVVSRGVVNGVEKYIGRIRGR
jgi:hypothetical protein